MFSSFLQHLPVHLRLTPIAPPRGMWRLEVPCISDSLRSGVELPKTIMLHLSLRKVWRFLGAQHLQRLLLLKTQTSILLSLFGPRPTRSTVFPLQNIKEPWKSAASGGSRSVKQSCLKKKCKGHEEFGFLSKNHGFLERTTTSQASALLFHCFGKQCLKTHGSLFATPHASRWRSSYHP